MNIDVSASIVLYKSISVAKTAISVFLKTELQVRLYILDNSPTDCLKSQLLDFLSDNRVTYIFNNKNLGFGAAHNIAIQAEMSNSKYHLVLNPDVFLGNTVLEQLKNFMDKNENVGLAVPKVLYPDGRLQYVCKLLPTPFDLITRRFLPRGAFKSRMNKFELRQMSYDCQFEAPYIHGCFMFLRTEALEKVGIFDERFFMYPEDIDLTRRIHRQYKTMYYPGVSIIHKHEKGSYKNYELLFIHLINMVKYFNKWGWIFDKERKSINKRTLAQHQTQ